MYAGCVRWMLSHTVKAVCSGSLGYRIPASRFLICTERSNTIAATRRWSPFSTAVDDTEPTPEPKKKKHDPRAHTTITSVGRKIPHRLIQVISETGENMGTMHRADVLKLMAENGLKLVVLNEHQDPPVYRLMTGKQIHEEQLKLREKQKAKAGTWCPGTKSDVLLPFISSFLQFADDTFFFFFDNPFDMSDLSQRSNIQQILQSTVCETKPNC